MSRRKVKVKKSNKLTEETLTEKIRYLLKKDTLSLEERQVLLRYMSETNVSFMKKINDFKIDISKLQLTNGFASLDIEILDLYTEICRQYPTTGPSSIFNIFIKK